MKTSIKLKVAKCYGDGGEVKKGDVKLSEAERKKLAAKSDAQGRTDAIREMIGYKPKRYPAGSQSAKGVEADYNKKVSDANKSFTKDSNRETPKADADASKRIQDAHINKTEDNKKVTAYASSDDIKEKARKEANSKNVDGTKGTNSLKALATGYKKGGLVKKIAKKFDNGGGVDMDKYLPSDQNNDVEGLPLAEKKNNLLSSTEIQQAVKPSSGNPIAQNPLGKATGAVDFVMEQGKEISDMSNDKVSSHIAKPQDPYTYTPDVNPYKKGVGAKAALSGAAKGAATGAAVGPYGALIGGVVGLGSGIVKGIINSNKRDEFNQQEEVKMKQIGRNKQDPMYNFAHNFAEGGQVKGPGTAKSDSIDANLKKGSFVVPAENAGLAKKIRTKYLGEEGDKSANLSKGTKVKLSNGEHVFSPEEVTVLKSHGLDLNKLAPNAKPENKLAKGGEVGDEDDLDKMLKQLEADSKRINSEKQKKQEIEKQESKDKDASLLKSQMTKRYNDEKQKLDLHKRDVMKIAETLKDYRNGASYAKAKYTEEGLMNHLKEKIMEHKSMQNELEKYSNPANYKKTSMGYAFDPATAEQNRPASKEQPKNKFFDDSQPTGKENQSPEMVAQRQASNSSATNKAPSKELVGNTVADTVSNVLGLTMDQAKSYGLTDGSSANNLKLKSRIMSGEIHKGNYKTLNQPAAEPQSLSAEQIANKENDATINENATREPIDQKINTDPTLDELKSVDNTKLAGTTNDAPSDLPADKGNKKTAKEVFDEFGGVGGALGAAQAVGGIAGLLSQGKRPVYNIGQDVQDDVNNAKLESQYGLSDAERTLLDTGIEMNRRMENENILKASGGNAGLALANMRSVSNASNLAKLQEVATDAELKRNKRMFYSGLVNQLENRRRQKFEDSLTKFKENQQASAELTNAGLSNIFGAIESKRFAKGMSDIGKNNNVTFNLGQ